jgi:hypothetical protein
MYIKKSDSYQENERNIASRAYDVIAKVCRSLDDKSASRGFSFTLDVMNDASHRINEKAIIVYDNLKHIIGKAYCTGFDTLNLYFHFIPKHSPGKLIRDVISEIRNDRIPVRMRILMQELERNPSSPYR